MLVLDLAGIILLAASSDSRPVSNNYKERNENLTLLINYLKNFGYISMAIEEMPNLLSEETLINGIKMAQKFGGIEENGDPYDHDLQNLIRQKSINEYMDKGLDRETSRKYLLAAFDMWSKSGDINFYEADSKDSVDMLITHVNKHDAIELAHAWRPGPDNGGNVCFNAVKFIPKDDEHAKKIHGQYFATAVHEIGHALGIDHALSPSEIMYFAVSDRKGPSQRADAIHLENVLGPYINTKFPTYTEAPTDPMYALQPSDRDPPSACDTDIDAACVVKNKTYVFKRRWFWRFNFEGKVEGPPRKIFTLFKQFLPSETYIDAMAHDFHEPGGDRYFVFIGDHHYMMDFTFFSSQPNESVHLSESGIHVPKIDAAFHLLSKKEIKIFLFAG
ncbi:hypothetical protein HELRODRAFT_184019 [Helobdella robusta]|uniref:Peptidase metallopeptidase domain-containing protein n=1 Tax=Helobdella robusta TaxID=6412 RepID=T1FKF7_HELRO|nr:hypothetical protein HELRODRAFT_184019 [Helobdella robusta]ESO09629.1 hypothetical protein HELRODRAFT_184019 [Helobdella robusta]